MGESQHSSSPHVGHAVAHELDVLLGDREFWALIGARSVGARQRDKLARRAVDLYELTSPIVAMRVDEWAGPLDYAIGAVRDIADACAISSRKWSTAERADLRVPSRIDIETTLRTFGVTEWASTLGVELAPSDEDPANAESPGLNAVSDPAPSELAANWSRTIATLRQIASLRARNGGDPVVAARDAAAGLIAYARDWLVWTRASSASDAVAVAVTQLLAAQGIFVASWSEGSEDLFPDEAYLLRFLTSTGGSAWLVDHGVEAEASVQGGEDSGLA